MALRLVGVRALALAVRVGALMLGLTLPLFVASAAKADLRWSGTVSAGWASSFSESGGWSGVHSEGGAWTIDGRTPEGFGSHYFNYTGNWHADLEQHRACPDGATEENRMEASGSGTVPADTTDPVEQFYLDIQAGHSAFYLGSPRGPARTTTTDCGGGQYTSEAETWFQWQCARPTTGGYQLSRSGTRLKGTVSGTTGCYDGGSWSINYDLTVTCPDGTAPNGEWRCGPGPATDRCAEGAERGVANGRWSVRANLNNVPDPHLFDFSILAPYCFDGEVARIRGPSAFGAVDFGFTTGALEALGFEVRYDPEEEAVDTSNTEGRAEFTGDFDVIFSWWTLIDRIGIKKYLKEKVFAKTLEDLITRTIKKYGGSGLAHKLRREISAWFAKHEARFYVMAEKRLDEIRPGFLRKRVKDRVLKAMHGFFTRWRKRVTAVFDSRSASKQSAEDITRIVLDRLDDILDPKSTFSLWTPAVTVLVSRSGQVSITQENRYKHPALIVEQQP